MSADNSPSTEKRKVMKTCEQTGSPSRESNVPRLDLSCTFDAEGKPVVKSLTDKCRFCDWNGTPGNIFFTENQAATFGNPRLTRENLQAEASRCLRCNARRLILEEITRYEGATSNASDELWLETGHNGCVSYGVHFHGQPRGCYRFYEIFMPIEPSLPNVDGIITLPRRRTTNGTSLKDSMEQTIIWAREQISSCLHLHKHRAIQVNGRPTRLLDVDPDGKGTDVKLQDFSSISPDTSIEYAALSYCWGGHQPECITTPETLNRNLHHIWDLPQTFRDAVKVTRGLGLKYLWIDSICIIQGDENDWRREAGRMFDVYRGSKVTLAAVFGEDSRSGLRTTTIRQQTRLVANLTLGQSTYPLYFRPHHYLWNPKTGQHTHELSHSSPLLTRAWAYQERILSPRVLFFTESEVIFQCACEVKCECGSAIDGWKNRNENFCDKERISLATQLTADDRKGISLATAELMADDKKMETIQGLSHEEYFTEYLFKIQQTWRRLVVWDYSILDLTDRRDKLAALGAIAEQFQRVRPASRYLAGLWSNYLLEDLMWTSNRYHDMEKPDRPFSLPTWSWASMRSGVVYHLPLDGGRHRAEVVEATCIYAKDNRFGVLEKSTLILSGKMLSCALHGDGKLYEPNSPGGGAWECLSSYTLWDSGESGYPQDQEVYLLLLVDYGLEGVPSSDACGLILNAEDHNADPKIFSRLGVFLEMTFDCADEKKKYYPLDRAFKERGIQEKIEIR